MKKILGIKLGNSEYIGEYKKIAFAGDVKILDSQVNNAYGAGEVYIENSKIKNYKCAGETYAIKSEFENIKCAGEMVLEKCTCKNDCVVYGDFKVDYFECITLRQFGFNSKEDKVNNNKIEWLGNFVAQTFENCFEFNLNFEYKFKNIISYKPLTSNKEIVCENFYSFSSLNVESVNCENVTILTCDNILVNDVFGSNINIINQFKPDKTFKKINKTIDVDKVVFNQNIIKVNNIEGDNINIQSVEANKVSGINVIIGDLCVIDLVEYTNSINISPKAVVNNVVRL